MNPALRRGLLPVWRDRQTLQVGTDPRRAVAVTGMADAAGLIGLLDGSRDRDDVLRQARRLGVPAAVAERVLTLLAAAGALVDFPVRMLADLPAELRQAVQPVLAGGSVASGDGDGGARLLARRAETTVTVSGDGPVAAVLADLLTGSGVVAGLAGRGAARRPDLVVIVGQQSPARADHLARQGVPHLAVTADEGIGAVGPLVRPGASACLRCVHLTRADHDPAWPLVLAQRCAGTTALPPCDPVLATAVAAQAAAHVLAFADRAPLAMALSNGVVELVTPSWQWRRTTWRPHPACPCGAAGRPRMPGCKGNHTDATGRNLAAEGAARSPSGTQVWRAPAAVADNGLHE